MVAPISQPTFTPTTPTISITGATNIRITNLTLTLSDTEYSHSIINNCRKIMLKARTTASLKIAFEVTESGTKYLTIPGNTTFELDDLTLSGKLIYIQSPNGSVVVEILETY